MSAGNYVPGLGVCDEVFQTTRANGTKVNYAVKGGVTLCTGDKKYGESPIDLLTPRATPTTASKLLMGVTKRRQQMDQRRSFNGSRGVGL